MDISSSLLNVNIFAIILASLSYLILGSLWYSPLLFGKKWIELGGLSENDIKATKPIWMITLCSFCAAFAASFLIAMILGVHPNPEFGAIAGAAIAIFWVTTSKLGSFLYENQPFKLFLLHAGFDLIAFMMMGAIVGYWR